MSERREGIRRDLLLQAEQSIDERIDRWLEVSHQPLIGLHHFSAASTECLQLYRDGYFIGCIMVAQAVCEGIGSFVAARNVIRQASGEKKQEMVRRMNLLGIVSTSFCEAFDRIQGSFRNDFHHMNPCVDQRDVRRISRANILDLAAIENEVFEVDVVDGAIRPVRPKYWDTLPDGTVPAYLRCV